MLLNPVTKIAAGTSVLVAESSPARPPIEYQTENGFSIIRLREGDESIRMNGQNHTFLVRDPHGYELEIAVEITGAAVAEVVRRSRGRLTIADSYWIACAERHLAAYLSENDDYPPYAKIIVNQLSIDDLDLARRWD